MPGAERRLFHNGENVTSINGRPFRNQNLLNCSALGRFHFVLHLHRLDNDHANAGFDRGSLTKENTYHFAGHGRSQFLGTLIVSSPSSSP